MADNTTKPTQVDVSSFLLTVSDLRRTEAQVLIDIMHEISSETATMWGPSIVGFGTQHYKYDSGREGDMPQLGFSPRKAAITIYFSEGFNLYSQLLTELGTYKSSVSCLYIAKLSDVRIDVLTQMIKQSYELASGTVTKPSTVEEYVSLVPTAAKIQFEQLRSIVKSELPAAHEVLSYAILGYKTDEKRARVYISGWKDHVSMYPIPKDADLRIELATFMKGKGTLWFPLNKPLPESLIRKSVQSLIG